MTDQADRHLFLVEHDLRGLSPWQLATVHRALGEAVRRENRQGRQIRYVQRIYAPDEQRCLCLFEAAGPDLVRSVNDIAQFPLARIMVGAQHGTGPGHPGTWSVAWQEHRPPADGGSVTCGDVAS